MKKREKGKKFPTIFDKKEQELNKRGKREKRLLLFNLFIFAVAKLFNSLL
jgi:hypothetical protein